MKYGDVRKCPVCGAVVPALAAKCPECGFEFSGIEANLSSQKLAERLLQVNDIKKKIEIIETFPIPNTKADLFEFLTATQPRMRDISDPLSHAYFKKYQECINKAKASFADDANLKPYIDSFAAEEKELIKKQRRHAVKAWVRRHKWLTGFIVVFLFMTVGSIIEEIAASIESHIDATIVEQKTAIISDAILTGDKDVVMKTVRDMSELSNPTQIVSQLVESDNLDAAIYLYKHKSKKTLPYEERYSEYRDYQKQAERMIYPALIKEERMDEAWEYHEKAYSNDFNDPDNASSYYAYLNDVINYYCRNDQKSRARQFVKEHMAWFVSNIDMGSSYKTEGSEFKSDKVRKQLMKQINDY